MNDLATLFDKDPLTLTSEDKAIIKRAYREAQHKFNLGEKGAGSTKKVKERTPKIENIDDIVNSIIIE